MKMRQMTLSVRRWVGAHKRQLLSGLAVLVVVSVVGQLAYPHGRAVPFASIGGERIGWQEAPKVTLSIQQRFNEASAKLVANDSESTEKLSNLGASVDADVMARHVVEYPWLYRAIPFSILWYQPSLDRYSLQFNDSRLAQVSQQQAEQLSEEPTDAGLAIEGGELVVTAAESGHAVEVDSIVDAVKATRFGWEETEVKLPTRQVQARVSDAAVASVRQQAESALSQRLTIAVPGDDFDDVQLDRATLASWLSVTEDHEGNLALGISDEDIISYLTKLRDGTATKPTKTIVSTVDGKETAREPGKPGRAIDVDSLRRELGERLTQPVQDRVAAVAASFEPVSPPVEYRRSYTSSQAGLTAYVADKAAEGGIYIAIKQLNGDKWSAEGKATESIASASTYKPLLMLKVFDDIKNKDRSWNDRIGDETLSDCFESMIVVSSNECAEKLIHEYGVTPLTRYLHQQGFSRGTGFTFSKTTQTTARDLVMFIEGLEEADLVDNRFRKMMLEKMARQIYRQGIPAGSQGTVYNKVGFLWNYLHDMALVRHPQGDYAVAIMTEGKSWGAIAEMTREIERIMYG